MDLHISERLRKLLPPLTKEQLTQLKNNIEEDGRLTDPIIYWHDGKKNVVVDGMNRWDIVKGTDISYKTSAMKFASYEEAELWILNHQLGRRNLLQPAAVRKLRGDLYNRLKAQNSRERSPRGQFTTQGMALPGGQFDPTVKVAEKIGRETGVSPRTVKRDGARAANIDKLTKAAKAIAEKASDKDIKTLAALSSGDQNAVARAVRTGQNATVAAAVKSLGVKAKASENDSPRTRRAKSKPPKQYDGAYWFKQWQTQIGPLVRLVDKIAVGFAEFGPKRQQGVQRVLEDATQRVMKGLKIDD